MINLLKGGLTKTDFKAFACIVGYITMINGNNTYFRSEIMKNLQFLKNLYKNCESTFTLRFTLLKIYKYYMFYIFFKVQYIPFVQIQIFIFTLQLIT